MERPTPTSTLGSPPHTRGKGLNGINGILHIRITPAYAGKSRRTVYPLRRRKDHPRIRGEKTGSSNRIISPSGSPPHTRGKASPARTVKVLCGITPAYAGKSDGRGENRGRRQDHPRIRGEKPIALELDVSISGSPPHTRGKVVLNAHVPVRLGITPAYAGKSSSVSSIPACFKDHPRIRGEKAHTVSERLKLYGSPPHTRGKA